MVRASTAYLDPAMLLSNRVLSGMFQGDTLIAWIVSAIWVSLPDMASFRVIIAVSVTLLAAGCQTARVSAARSTESLALQHREIMDWFAGEQFRRSGYNALKAPQNYNQAYSCLRSDNLAQFRYGMVQGERLGGPRVSDLFSLERKKLFYALVILKRPGSSSTRHS